MDSVNSNLVEARLIDLYSGEPQAAQLHAGPAPRSKLSSNPLNVGSD